MIKIAVVSYDNETPLTPISAVFGAEQGTIGRSDDNFLALPDPKHFVSRSQAKVWSNGNIHKLVNLSLANPILINKKEIEPELEIAIQAGDQIQIGLYLLKVVATDVNEVTTASHSDKPQTGSPVIVAPSAEVKNSPTPPVPPSAAKIVNPLAAARVSQPPQFLLRPDQSVTDNTSAAAPSASTSSVTTTNVQQTPTSDATAVAEPSKLQIDQSELLQAFLNGAGLTNLTISSGLTPELMETLGKLVATSVQGTMGLISQRALVKREVNAEVTMVVLRKNNPLKFFPDSQTVLTQMLRKKMPGFMAPSEAMEDAFLDLRAHQLGVVAGTKAAMDALLKKFQPTRFERHLKATSFLDNINPARRKAEMWDHFSALFDRISLESKDEFQTLFGKEFLAAYEEEVERARQESTAS